jgi:VanZ family protein
MESEANGVTESRNRVQTILRAALVCYWVTLFVATHIPKLPQVVERISDKAWHLAGYGILALLLAAATSPTLTVRGYSLLLGLLAGYAIFDELLQIPVGRHCDALDWVADMLGALIGLGSFALLATLSRHRHET